MTSYSTAPSLDLAHPLPAANHLPVADVALAPPDVLCGLRALLVRHQCGEHRRDLGPQLALAGQVEALLDKRRAEQPSDEAGAVDELLVEGDIDLEAHSPVLGERP